MGILQDVAYAQNPPQGTPPQGDGGEQMLEQEGDVRNEDTASNYLTSPPLQYVYVHKQLCGCMSQQLQIKQYWGLPF